MKVAHGGVDLQYLISKAVRMQIAGVVLTAAGMCATATAEDLKPPYVRLDLRYPGVYRVTGAELTSAGVPLASVKPGAIGLTSAGEQVPVFVSGAADGSFDSADYIEFVGASARGTATWFLPENKRNVYFLTWNERNPLQYKEEQTSSPAAEPPSQHFRQWQHKEQNYQFWFSTLPPDQTDNFFWFPVFANTRPEEALQVNLHVPGYDKSLNQPVKLDLHIFGSTEAAGLKPSHQFNFLYDGEAIEEVAFDGVTFHDVQVEIPAAKVKPEPTRYGLSAPENRRNVVDRIFLDWVNVSYPSKLDAAGFEYYVFNNDLLETTQSTDTLYIANLPTSGSIFDPGSLRIWKFGPDQGTVAIPNSTKLTTYTAVASQARMKLDHLDYITSMTRPSDLPADLETLVVYHPRLTMTAQSYAKYRKGRGAKVEAVSVRDIFDQANNGYIKDTALKSYVEQVKEHAPELKALVLIGDSYFDFREARSFDEENQFEVLIPIHWVSRPGVAWSGGYQDDNWYGSFENEFRPDISVGRIAINSDAEGMDYLRKVIEYEVLRNSSKDKALFISSVEKSFQQYVTEIGTKYADRLSSVSYQFPEAEKATQEVADLMNALNKGAQLVYYVGHGGAMVWRVGPVDFARQKDLFTPKEVRQLTNHGHYPVVVCASCYTTSFDQPESIGEALVNQPGGGAIAVIGAPWKATVQESHDFNRLFFKYYFDPTVKTIGDASLLAHREHIPENQGHALFNSFTLLGDPCLEIIR